MITHSDATPYVCLVCGKRYKSGSGYRRHVNKFHQKGTVPLAANARGAPQAQVPLNAAEESAVEAVAAVVVETTQPQTSRKHLFHLEFEDPETESVFLKHLSSPFSGEEGGGGAGPSIIMSFTRAF